LKPKARDSIREEVPMLTNHTPVKHFSARLELPNNHTVIEIVGDDLTIVKEQLQTFTKGGIRFEPFGDSTLVYHPMFAAGKQAIGWIAPFEVPQYLSNKALIDSRMQMAQQAA
jgi:hypothetical protein